MQGPRLLVALVILLAVGACAVPDHYVSVLEGLSIPSAWAFAETRVTGSGGNQDCAFFLPKCPHVSNYYYVDGVPSHAYAEAKDMLARAGFNLDEEFHPDCDGGGGGACTAVSSKGSDDIQVVAFEPGDRTDGLAEPDRSLVRVTAEAK
jgi:hypothetical protein